MLSWKIEKILKSELKTFKSCLKKVVASSNGISPLTEHFTDFQGKHLRPILTMLAAKAVAPGKPLEANHFNLAVTVELIHNAALVHDDVLDEAKLRRNVQTYNQRWGNEMAVMFGDYLFARLFSHITTVQSAGLIEIISATSNRICLGELKHLMKRFNPHGLSEQEYLEIIDNKTASLFTLAAYLGAVASTNNKKTIAALKSYGQNFGMAYQIMDDYKDIAESDQTSGKSTGNDLFKGKITLPIIRTARNSPEKIRNRMKDILSSVTSNGRDLSAHKKELHKLLQQDGSLDYTLQQAKRYVNLAVKNMSALKSSTYKDILASLAESVIS
ncbi:MAG: polyprenyl synthetase family protein [Planctomycetes bacterium]|nr:polyprenyl synthetase family protein [Planctomycetota bacterium]